MAIIKAPPKQPKSAVQARVEESVKEHLELYAKFIGSTQFPVSRPVTLLERMAGTTRLELATSAVTAPLADVTD